MNGLAVRLGRGPFALTARRCVAVAAVPTLVAAVAGFVAWRVAPPDVGTEQVAAAASPWLVLPLLVAAATVAFTAALTWPTFALGRPGRALVDRVHRGALGGAGAATAGALAAQLVLVLPLATVFALALGAPATAAVLLPLVAEREPLLDARRPRLAFAVGTDAPVHELWLRPVAGLPAGGFEDASVELFADGERLAAAVAFADTQQLVRVPFAARRIRELHLVHAGGTIPLLFPPGAATLVRAAGHAGLANGAWLAAASLVPVFVALALGCCCGRVAGVATVLTVIGGALVVQTIGGVGPFDGAVVARMRGHWLGPTLFPDSAASLAVGALAMIVAMQKRREVRR